MIVNADTGASVAVFDESSAARAQLAAAAPDMARLLIEFAHLDGDLDACPWCADDGARAQHAPTCPLAAALRKAGILALDEG